MLLDLDLLKARLGIEPGDTSKDAVITATAEQAQALCEAYCDRLFDLAADEETFAGVTRSLQVRRYPITEIAELVAGTALDAPPPNSVPLACYRADAEKGLVWPAGWGAEGFWPVLRCRYTGGFQTAPPGLLWALTRVFDILWSGTPGGGLPAGAVSGGAFDAVKRFSVVGAYSVELGSSGDAGDPAGGGDNAFGVLTPAETAVLDGYRRAAAIGIG